MNVFDALNTGLKAQIKDPNTGKAKRGPKRKTEVKVLSTEDYLRKAQEDYLWNNPACWEWLDGGDF